jgi:hypothetical protein
MTRVLGRQSFGSVDNHGNLLNKEEARALLESWVPNAKLRNHMFQVGYLLKKWAELERVYQKLINGNGK